MKKIARDDRESKSADIVASNVEALKTLFPEAFTEGQNGPAIDFEVLKGLLGAAVDEREEKYGLNWHGKRRARQLALTPSTGTLRPCPGDSVDWDTTQNLMIEGDNLEVLKLLQKSYAGKVRLIYIDPPYNTGKDFVYPDKFHDNIQNYLELTGQIGEGGKKLSSNTEASGRFHTDWLNMMYPRLKLARNLLHRDGAIFITIDDGEISRLRMLCDDVFGEENFIANVVWQKKQSPQNDAINLSDMHDHVAIYAKQARTNKSDTSGWLRKKITRGDTQEGRYENKDNDARGDWTSADLTCNKTSAERPNLYFAITNPHSGEEVWPSQTRVWGYEKPAMIKLLEECRIWWGATGNNKPRLKIFRSEVDDGVVPSTWWDREFAGDNQDAKREIRTLFDGREVFDTPKPTSLIRRFLEIGGGEATDQLVLDFFAGSGSTGDAVYQQNAANQEGWRFILVQIPEPLDQKEFGVSSIAEVTKERLRRAAKKIRQDNPLFRGDTGFRVLKLASTNIQAWEPDSEKLAETLEASVEHLKIDRSEQDILFELLLKLGLDLCVPIETKHVAGGAKRAHEIYSIGGGSLLVCLSAAIPDADVEPLALGLVAWHKELKPAGETTVVLRDSAFADDVAKTNLTAILHQHNLETVRSL